MMTTAQIDFENIPLEKIVQQPLEEAITDNLDLSTIQRYVETYVFTKYISRRRFALTSLRDVLSEAQVEVKSREDQGVIYAYLYFPTANKYLLAKKFAIDSIVWEDIPTKKEFRLWLSRNCV